MYARALCGGQFHSWGKAKPSFVKIPMDVIIHKIECPAVAFRRIRTNEANWNERLCTLTICFEDLSQSTSHGSIAKFICKYCHRIGNLQYIYELFAIIRTSVLFQELVKVILMEWHLPIRIIRQLDEQCVRSRCSKDTLVSSYDTFALTRLAFFVGRSCQAATLHSTSTRRASVEAANPWPHHIHAEGRSPKSLVCVEASLCDQSLSRG